MLLLAGKHSLFKQIAESYGQHNPENLLIEQYHDTTEVEALLSVNNTNNDIIVLIAMPDNCDQAETWLALVKRYQHCYIAVIAPQEESQLGDYYRWGAVSCFPSDIGFNVVQAWLQGRLMHFGDTEKAIQDAINESHGAAQAATIAMTNASELGRVIHFIESTFDMHAPSALANGIFHLLGSLGLRACLCFRWSHDPLETYGSDNGPVPEDDIQLLEQFQASGRIVDFSQRTLVNYPRVSLLVQNMPVEDAEQYGRIKDLLPIILGAVNEKLATLDQEKTIYQNSLDTVQAFSHFRNITFRLAKQHNEISTNAIDELTTMKDLIFARLPGLGLDEDQERYIESILEEMLDKVACSFQASSENTASLLMNVAEVKSLNQRLEQIAETFAPKIVEPEQITIDSEDEQVFDDDDIELF